MTTQLVGNKCDGGHYTCSPPKECCKQGCCFLLTPSVYRPPSSSIQVGGIFSPLFLGHWYFWLAVTATIVGIVCACSLWRRHNQYRGDGGSWLSSCCRPRGCSGSRARGRGGDERASEPDSVDGSCYAPPLYASRCELGYRQQPPPPYAEVASKPDLYPLVISYNGDFTAKNNNNSTPGYIMVQYIKNFISRPVGSLSATSTIDSLSSTFLCNATNEANTIIPPPYSHASSLEEVTTSCDPPPPPQVPPSTQQKSAPPPPRIPRSASSTSTALPGDPFPVPIQRSPSAQTPLSAPIVQLATPLKPSAVRLVTPTQTLVTPKHRVLQIRSNPCFVEGIVAKGGVPNFPKTVPNAGEQSNIGNEAGKSQSNCDFASSTAHSQPNRRLLVHKPKNNSQDSTTDEEHNFSDLLNLSVCLPSNNVIHLENPIHSAPHLHELPYSIANSIGSDISSLANLGTPDSPPRATSPTGEMKELLDKIQQLPTQKSPLPHQEAKHSRNYFHKVKAQTMYMPLNDHSSSSIQKSRNNIPNVFSKGWLSRSAPCTPSGNFVPNFPAGKSSKGAQKTGSRSKITTDGSPLLKEHTEDSEEESHRDECL